MYRGLNRRSSLLRNPLTLFFYLNPKTQYSVTVMSTLLLALFIFSGVLTFRYADGDDLMFRGQKLMSEGKIALAAKAFQHLVSKQPGNYDARLLLGQAYLDLGERALAEAEFKAASELRLRGYAAQGGGIKEISATVAMARFATARKEFEPAEKQLLLAYKGNSQDPEVRQALFELYHSWGDTLAGEAVVEEPPVKVVQSLGGKANNTAASPSPEGLRNYPAIISKYERALRYVREYRLEDQVKEKLITAITAYTDALNTQQKFAESIFMLKKSLRYRYLPDTLIEIAQNYEKIKDIDEAIEWYRRAFEVNPNAISFKLSNLLISRGRELSRTEPEKAEALFTEAKRVNETASVPLEVLFPIKITGVKVVSQVDQDTGTFMPKVTAKIENGATRPLNFLLAKATFYSGSVVLAEVSREVVTPDRALDPKTKEEKASAAKSSVNVEFTPDEALSLAQVQKNHIRVKLSVSYTDANSPLWKDLAIQETNVIRRKAPIPRVEEKPDSDESTQPASPEAAQPF